MPSPSIDELTAYLTRRFRDGLPGRRVQRLASPPLSYGRHHGPAPHDARRAAVVAMLYLHDGQWHVPLTVRAQRISRHQGQVAFPGGGLECGESDWEAGRRELHEEIGVALDDASVVGRLSSVYVFASNFDVVPLVAVSKGRPEFHIAPAEVDELLEIPLSDLPGPDDWKRGPVPHRDCVGRVPRFMWKGHVVWGASAMILAELVSVLHPLAGACGEEPRSGIYCPR